MQTAIRGLGVCWLPPAHASFSVGGKGQTGCLLHSFRVVWTWKKAYETANSRNKPDGSVSRCQCNYSKDALTHWRPFRSSHCREFHPHHPFTCHLLRYLLNRQYGFRLIHNFPCYRRGISPGELRLWVTPHRTLHTRSDLIHLPIPTGTDSRVWKAVSAASVAPQAGQPVLRWDGPVFEGKPWMTFYVTDVIVGPEHDVDNSEPEHRC